MSESTEKAYGPHPAALAHAAADALTPTIVGIRRDAVRRAHDPALGLDRSVCLRDVLTAMREEADTYSGEIGVAGSVYRIGADFIEARFTEQPDA